MNIVRFFYARNIRIKKPKHNTYVPVSEEIKMLILRLLIT